MKDLPTLHGLCDVNVSIVESLPGHLVGGVAAGLFALATPDTFLQDVPAIGRYLATNGNKILVAPDKGSAPSAIEAFLNGSPRSAIIHQRGEIPLEASTLAARGARFGVAIAGSSGMGRSTLAATLCGRGWRLVADDMTRISLDGSEGIACPGPTSIDLWRDGAERLGLDLSEPQRVRDGLEKFSFPVPGSGGPVPLGAIVALSPSDEMALVPVLGAQRLVLLSEFTRHVCQLAPLGRLAGFLRLAGTIASTVSVFRIGGARRVSIELLADRIAELGA